MHAALARGRRNVVAADAAEHPVRAGLKRGEEHNGAEPGHHPDQRTQDDPLAKVAGSARSGEQSADESSGVQPRGQQPCRNANVHSPQPSDHA